MLLIHPMSIGFRSIECPPATDHATLWQDVSVGTRHSAERPPGAVTQLRADARLT